MNSNTPQIRFRGCQGEWEKKEFGDIITSFPFSPYLCEPQEEGKYQVIQQGDTPLAGYANGRPMTDIDGIILWGDHTRSVYQPLTPFFVASDGLRIFKVSNTDNSFNPYIFERYKPVSRGYSRHATILVKTTLFLPRTKEEQKKIGSLLIFLDRVSTAQREKVERLRKLKAALLDKLFPKPGQTVPELRVNGCKGKWEEKKLSEIVSPYSELVPTPKNGYARLGIRSHGKGTFHSYVANGEELETAQMSVVRADMLIMNITFAWELAVAITTQEDVGKLVSHRFPQFAFNEEMAPSFFRYSLINEKFRRHLFLASPGSAGRNRVLKTGQMLEFKLYVPSSHQEQCAIASLLTSYDRLIALSETRLTKLRQLKSSLLEKMFV